MTSNAVKTRQERNTRAQQAGAERAWAERMASNLGRPTRIQAGQIQAILGPINTALLAFRMGTAGTRPYHDLAAGLSVAYYAASRVARHRHLMPDIKAGLDALTSVFERCHAEDDSELYLATDEEMERLELAAEIYGAILHSVSWAFLRRAIEDAMPR